MRVGGKQQDEESASARGDRPPAHTAGSPARQPRPRSRSVAGPCGTARAAWPEAASNRSVD